ncbi:MAG: 50S ribosomal protein L3 [Deltaproteobacteria bacterium]|nr:50S ribosomal protein L3 [Deltaproteobacteria bacterium]MBW2541369.1 50S ribosomal protein L3 [Deltaproteobacteria bacterium]
MTVELLCRKIGMTQIFEESGEAIPVTVLDASPNLVIQKKSEEKDGYTALQLGFGDRRPSGADKAQQGHFKKAGVAPKRYLAESRISAEDAEAYEVGQEIKVEIFEKGQRVDVIGNSKGRGTAGVIKRHGFAVKRRTHGTHENFRHGGAIGAGSYPGRVFKGMKMSGRMGNERITTLNLEVARVDAERGLLFVNGAVPGHDNAIVRVRKTIKADRNS